MDRTTAILYSSLLLNSIYGLHIQPDTDELIITSGADISLTCTNDKPVKWSYPNQTDLDEGSTKVTSEKILEDGSHEVTLAIQGVYYLDTGFYVCEEIETNVNEKMIYIYVRDDKKLLALKDNFAFLTKEQYDSLIIPCKPTSPDVNVTLKVDKDAERELQYDPKRGFIWNSIQLTNSGFYECEATRGETTESAHYEVMITYKTTGVSKPIINSLNPHIVIGHDVTLNCMVTVADYVFITLEWKLPAGVDEARVSQQEYVEKKEENGRKVREAHRRLTIKNITAQDAGAYVCQVTDHSDHTNQEEYTLKVVTANMTYLNLTMEGDNEILVRVGESKAQWIVDIAAHPPAEITWYGNNGQKLLSYDRYQITTTSESTKVMIKDLAIMDSGVYTLKAENDLYKRTLNVTLLVQDKPSVQVRTEPFYMVGKTFEIRCAVVAFPLPSVNWTFTSCRAYPSCEMSPTLIPPVDYTELPSRVQLDYTTHLLANETGKVTCQACNFIGCENETVPFLVTDIENGFDVWASAKEFVSLDKVVLGCGASVYHYAGELEWLVKENNVLKLLSSTPETVITEEVSQYSYKRFLTFPSINKTNSGRYICRARNHSNIGEIYEKFIDLNVKELKAPYFISDQVFSSSLDWYTDIGKEVSWTCPVEGVPNPTVIWYKDNNVLIMGENETRVQLSNYNQTLTIQFTVQADEGHYVCVATNRAGNLSLEFILRIKNPIHKSKWLWITIFIAILFAMICSFIVMFFYTKAKQEKKLRQSFALAGLSNFADGQIDSINPELDIHEQADLLPYDKKWEFPREKLKLGKQLGSGAFGVVLKAEAYGLKDNDEPTIVAVKMVKKNSDLALIKALASELKIMAHLGQHLNVLNLIGACTQNINNRELLVLVEFCRYGNLHLYLLKHRAAFINQVNPSTGQIEKCTRDFFPDKKLESDNPLLSEDSNRTMKLTTDPTSESTSICQTVNTDMTSLSTPVGDDGYLISKEPDWRSYYQGDYKASHVKPICTQDLLCWGYQVSRGMEYLASRKVLHGDLAARNILLAEGNIVKICDFGLAKSMYKSGNYCKKGDDPLPVKWMSIEALRDRVFSTQSDIWAFGIVLWEMFTLAKTPYPGIQFGQKLFNKLLEGYRMEKPEFATDQVYALMQECWNEEPMARPSFTECAERLGNMLEESVKQHYIDLNDPYLQLNSQMTSQSDYLSMLNAPTFANYCSPSVGENQPGGYLIMQRGPHEMGDEMELKPMLSPGNNYINSVGFKSFLNPSYEGLSKLKENSYVNVPQSAGIEV